ncbi:MAG TPA: hypothetical protein VNA04_12685 [Thermoanaerobaculia bacterium]|nr:hypothetical protein [Thermoanaerobaculia bacterium]
MRHGETASIRDREGRVVFTYRGFASIVGIVAALVLTVVLLTGLASALFLNAEDRPGAAMAAAVLAFLFGFVIAALIPRTRVTLYHESEPALRIVQTSRFSLPAATWFVRTADGTTLAHLRKSAVSRLGMNRWSISVPPGQSGVAWAAEESFGRALVRKVLGKFRPRFEANMRVIHHGVPAAVIVRRPDSAGEADYLEVTPGSDLDPRVTLALATLVFGLEP